MPEHFNADKSRERRMDFESQEFASAARELLIEMTTRDRDDEPFWNLDGIDISDPKTDDMDNILSRNFTITNFQSNPVSGSDKRTFHFNVGGTEFHITGQAAERIYQLTNQME